MKGGLCFVSKGLLFFGLIKGRDGLETVVEGLMPGETPKRAAEVLVGPGCHCTLGITVTEEGILVRPRGFCLSRKQHFERTGHVNEYHSALQSSKKKKKTRET